MTSSEEPARAGSGVPGAWWPATVVVVIATLEALAVSYAVDAQSVLHRGGIWRVFGSGGLVLTWLGSVLAMVGLLWVLRGDGSVSKPPDARPTVFLALLHTVSIVTFFALSWRIFAPGAVPSGWDGVLIVGWVVSGIAVAVSLLRLAVTWRWVREALGGHWRALVFAVLTGTVAWGAGQLSQLAWTPLAPATLNSVVWLLQSLEPEVLYHPLTSMVGTPRFRVTVAPVCSGIEGVGLMPVFMGVLLWVGRERLKPSRAWVLIPLSTAAVWIANLLRITSLIELGTHVSPAVALGGFHSKAGWLLFCGIALAVSSLALRSSYLTGGQPVRRSTQDDWNPTVAYLAPLMVLLAASMVTALFSAGGLDYLYGLRVVAVAGTLALVARRFRPLKLEVGWHALLVGVVVYLIWVVLTPNGDPERVATARQELDALAPALFWAWVALRTVGSVVAVPIAEELGFRGFLLPRLISEDFTQVAPRRLTVFSLVVSSLAFGLLHQSWIAGTIAGAAYAWARQFRGKLGDAIAAHALTNLIIAVDVLVRGSYYLWL